MKTNEGGKNEPVQVLCESRKTLRKGKVPGQQNLNRFIFLGKRRIQLCCTKTANHEKAILLYCFGCVSAKRKGAIGPG